MSRKNLVLIIDFVFFVVFFSPEVDHEAEFPAESVETLQIKCSENSSNIIATTVPVIVTTTSHSTVIADPPKDQVIEETRGKLPVFVVITGCILI